MSSDNDLWLVVKRGTIQHVEQNGILTMPVFAARDDVVHFVDGHGCSAALVGSIEGESFERHLDLAEQAGATPVLVVKRQGQYVGYPIRGALRRDLLAMISHR